MFVILTSKPGQFRTELGDHLEALESYDYVFCGRKRAQFVIATLLFDAKTRIVDETAPPVVNLVPSKFLPKFDTLAAARDELKSLAGSGGMDIALVKQEPR
jgi:hypothetical protein